MVMTKRRSAANAMFHCAISLVTLAVTTMPINAQAEAPLPNQQMVETKQLPPIRTIEDIQKSAGNYSTRPISKNAEDYFEFVDAMPESSELHDLRAWNAEEKAAVRVAFENVFEQLPGLVVHAAGGRKLAFFRSGLDREEQSKASAYRLPEGLLFSDGFFNGDPQYAVEVFLHELVHCADFGGQIAFSKDWVQFADPIISELRETNKLLHPGEFSDTLVKGKWVSYYGTANLSEALAEYFRVAMKSSDSAANRPFAPFAEKLKFPTKEELQFQDRVKNASIFLRAHKYDEAIIELKEAQKLIPQTAWVSIQLAAAHSLKKDFTHCLAESRKSMALIEDAKIPDSEPDPLYLQRTRSYALQKRGKHRDALKILDELCIMEPDSRYAFLARAASHEKLGHLSDTALNYYELRRDKPKLADYRALTLDPTVVLAALDDRVHREPGNPDAYEIRANYKEHLGDLENDRSLKEKHYESALDDINKSKLCPDANAAHAAISSARLFLKLNDLASAQSAYQQAVEKDPGNMEVRIFNLKLLEVRGHKREAKQQYTAILMDLAKSAHLPSQ